MVSAFGTDWVHSRYLVFDVDMEFFNDDRDDGLVFLPRNCHTKLVDT
jgi:hypothetical protein